MAWPVLGRMPGAFEVAGLLVAMSGLLIAETHAVLLSLDRRPQALCAAGPPG